MRKLVWSAALLSLVALPACHGTRHAPWEKDSAAAARKIEVQVDATGRYREIEYHIAPDQVPAAVRKAMDQLHPGGPFDDAEKESDGGKVYYELSRKANGMEIEAMFLPDGSLHSEEIQIPMSKVPEAVRGRALSSMPGAQATKWEEIRDGRREVTAYHVKLSRGGDKYKVMFSADGTLEGMVREVPAEIEVPVEAR